MSSSSPPATDLDSGHYAQEYDQAFADRFDDYVDWERRAVGEGGFFPRLLAEHGVKTVLDVACGTGFHSIQLLKAGFDVTSVDGSAAMLAKAAENAHLHGVELDTTCADWRTLQESVSGRFDAVVCLGNSLTYLRPEDRGLVLAHFTTLLKPGGLLVVDHRNYDAILDEGFRFKGRFYYCGDVSSVPDHADEDLTRFRIRFSDGVEFTTCMFPVRLEPTRRLLQDAGLVPLATFGDFEDPAPADADFYIHVARKDAWWVNRWPLRC